MHFLYSFLITEFSGESFPLSCFWFFHFINIINFNMFIDNRIGFCFVFLFPPPLWLLDLEVPQSILHFIVCLVSIWQGFSFIYLILLVDLVLGGLRSDLCVVLRMCSGYWLSYNCLNFWFFSVLDKLFWFNFSFCVRVVK